MWPAPFNPWYSVHFGQVRSFGSVRFLRLRNYSKTYFLIINLSDKNLFSEQIFFKGSLILDCKLPSRLASVCHNARAHEALLWNTSIDPIWWYKNSLKCWPARKMSHVMSSVSSKIRNTGAHQIFILCWLTLKSETDGTFFSFFYFHHKSHQSVYLYFTFFIQISILFFWLFLRFCFAFFSWKTDKRTDGVGM